MAIAGYSASPFLRWRSTLSIAPWNPLIAAMLSANRQLTGSVGSAEPVNEMRCAAAASSAGNCLCSGLPTMPSWSSLCASEGME